MPPIRLSVLGRIARGSGRITPGPASVEDLRTEVTQHLEWILNSRPGYRSLPPELQRTVLDFGLPDFKVSALDEVRVRDRIADLLVQTVAAFEPRLSDIHVIIDPGIGKDLRFRVHLSALLQVEPEPEPFHMDSLLDLATHEVIVV
ncbi:MAG: type VI secretion system baseplate subunit TssE [Isosphaeraceae bacterium]